MYWINLNKISKIPISGKYTVSDVPHDINHREKLRPSHISNGNIYTRNDWIYIEIGRLAVNARPPR